MKRSHIVHVVLSAVIMAVLVAGCSSSTSSSKGVVRAAENEVTLAGYQAGSVAAPFGAIGTEVTMPLWFISGK